MTTRHLRTITPSVHASIVAQSVGEDCRSGLFAKLGESQDAAIKRLTSASKRAANDRRVSARDFPVYSPGMSTAEYVAAYEALRLPTVRAGFWQPLNTAPAALYEGGLMDYAPAVEVIDDEDCGADECSGLDALAVDPAPPGPTEPAEPTPPCSGDTASQAQKQASAHETLSAARLAYVPARKRDTSQRTICKGGDAEAWTWTDAGRLYAVAFFGRSSRPYSGSGGAGAVYRFATEQLRRDWIAECFRRARAHAQRITERKSEKAAKRAAGHGLQVGDVLRASWGYDQTNIDYYQITARIGAQMVEYRPIGQISEGGDMTGYCVPSPDAFTGPAKRARVSEYGDRDSIKVSSCATARKIRPAELPGGLKAYAPDYWTAYA